MYKYRYQKNSLPSRRLPASQPPPLLPAAAAGLSLATTSNFISISTSLECWSALLCSCTNSKVFLSLIS